MVRARPGMAPDLLQENPLQTALARAAGLRAAVRFPGLEVFLSGFCLRFCRAKPVRAGLYGPAICFFYMGHFGARDGAGILEYAGATRRAAIRQPAAQRILLHRIP